MRATNRTNVADFLYSGDVLTFARTHFARAERVVALNCIVRPDCVVIRTNASRTRSRTHVCKNQKISLHFPRVSSPHPFTAKRKKKWKGNFWFCFAVSVSEKSNLILTFLFALFYALTATEALPYPRLVETLTYANHTQTPTHSPLAFARADCFGVVCVSACGFV